MEIKRKDWEELRKNAEDQLKGAMISTLQFQTLLDLCDKNITQLEDSEGKELEKEIEEASDDSA